MTPGTDALQAALAAEHAAVYVYGALGGQTSASEESDLHAILENGLRVHQLRRDDLIEAIARAGETPDGAAAAYELPRNLGDRATVQRAARQVEHRCQQHYAAVVAATVGEVRRWAVTALRRSAVDVLAVRGTPEMLPGTGEYA